MGGGGVKVGSGVHNSYTFLVQTDGIFYFPWHPSMCEAYCRWGGGGGLKWVMVSTTVTHF